MLFLHSMAFFYMKRFLFIGALFGLLALPKLSQAQYNTDFGFRLGAAFYFGDLAGTGATPKFGPLDIQFNQMGLNFGLSGRKFLTPAFALQGGFNYARLKGTDEFSNESPERYSRNLSFRNDIFELSARFEYHFLHLRDVGHTYRHKLGFTSFIFLGAGAFYNNPKAELNGTWHALQPIETEGNKYSKIQMAVPMGLGFEFRINKKHLIGWEVSARMTFTDYVDDVSSKYQHNSKFDDDPIAKALQDRSVEIDPQDQSYVNPVYYSYGSDLESTGIRGDEDNNDWYMWTGVTYKYSIRGKRKSKFNKRRYPFVHRKIKRRRSRAKF